MTNESRTELNLAGYDEDSEENITENRRRFLAAFHGKHTLSTVWQIHSNYVKAVDTFDEAANTDEKYDALVSNLDGLLVGVKTADCVPVLVGDPVSRSYAAIHAGWRGTVASIVTNAVNLLKERYRADPENMIAAIGPSACGRTYEIGSDVIDAFTEKFSESEKYFTPTREDHARVDLKYANRDQLVDAGLQTENIFVTDLCTIESVELFFSYRVEKRLYGKTGRSLSVIGLANAK